MVDTIACSRYLWNIFVSNNRVYSVGLGCIPNNDGYCRGHLRYVCLSNPMVVERKGRIEIINKTERIMMREYEKREFCKDQCPIQKILQTITYNFDQVKELKHIICEKNCIKPARDFHKWLQRKGFKITKEDE